MNLRPGEPDRYRVRMSELHLTSGPDRARRPVCTSGDPEIAALHTKLRYCREHVDAIGQEFKKIVDQIDRIFSGRRIHLPPTAIEKAQQVQRDIDNARSELARLLATFGIEHAASGSSSTRTGGPSTARFEISARRDG